MYNICNIVWLQLRDVQDMYEDSLSALEDELNLIKRENEDLRDE